MMNYSPVVFRTFVAVKHNWDSYMFTRTWVRVHANNAINNNNNNNDNTYSHIYMDIVYIQTYDLRSMCAWTIARHSLLIFAYMAVLFIGF